MFFIMLENAMVSIGLNLPTVSGGGTLSVPFKRLLTHNKRLTDGGQDGARKMRAYKLRRQKVYLQTTTSTTHI